MSTLFLDSVAHCSTEDIQKRFSGAPVRFSQVPTTSPDWVVSLCQSLETPTNGVGWFCMARGRANDLSIVNWCSCKEQGRDAIQYSHCDSEHGGIQIGQCPDCQAIYYTIPR